jgi:curli biogenesis system outer membrane secretion channel CsgG
VLVAAAAPGCAQPTARPAAQPPVQPVSQVAEQEARPAAAPAVQPAGRRDGQPDTRPTVAVMYFDNGALINHADYEPLGRGVADMLITELGTNPSIRVVERDQIQKLIAEVTLNASGHVDRDQAVRMGKILGAHHIILGGFVIDPKGRMRLDARAVRTETSEVEYVETVTDKADNLLGMVADLAKKMNSGMRLPANPVRRDADAGGRGGRGQFNALMLFSRALAEEDRGNVPQAIALYKATLAQLPTYEPAQRKLTRLQRPA